jgi:hypothetical protein
MSDFKGIKIYSIILKMSNEEWEGKPGQECLVICESVTEVLNPKQNIKNIPIKCLCLHIIFSWKTDTALFSNFHAIFHGNLKLQTNSSIGGNIAINYIKLPSEWQTYILPN